MSRSIDGFEPSSASFALVYLPVQRASLSCCRFLDGLAFHCSGVSPAFSAAFSSLVLRCFGAAMQVESINCPDIGM